MRIASISPVSCSSTFQNALARQQLAPCLLFRKGPNCLQLKDDVFYQSPLNANRNELQPKSVKWAVNAVQVEPDVAAPLRTYADKEDYIKAGGTEIDLVVLQANKSLDQPKISNMLSQLNSKGDVLDLVIVGCGPAGLSLAAESAKRGLSVGLIGPDVPFVNNYGVWVDEFQDIGLSHCLDFVWEDAALYLESNKPVFVGRPYGRVSRHLLRQELLERCAKYGVTYLDAEVEEILDPSDSTSHVKCSNGELLKCRLATVAAGAASGKFLSYEKIEMGVGVQTAYGVEVEVDSYPYDTSIMHFMDYRDFQPSSETVSGSENDEFEKVPSFLYAMPLSSNRVFFEETCLAARPAMPFEVLKERLHQRLKTLGISFSNLHEEEWSYIPVGGALPETNQRRVGFGAAASMIHPATGYSIARSLKEAPNLAETLTASLKNKKMASQVAALQAWDTLWSQERKRQRAFMLFGLELILQLDLSATRDFFETFFRLPEGLWKGFLGSNLSSVELIQFALVTFVIAPNSLRFKLVHHLVTDPSGAALVKTYLGLNKSS